MEVPEPEFFRAVDADRAMRGGNDQAATGEMDADKTAQAFLSRGVEALAGSSSSQIGRLTESSRAIERRRRWPADR